MEPIATLIYDGLCPRCSAFARWGGRWSQGRLRTLALDQPGAMDLHRDLSFARATAAPQVVLANGYLCQGAEAAAWVLGSRRGFAFIPILYRAPLLKQGAQLCYWAFKARPQACEACP
jgi:predicted DCC family thiol-disulfide oxidoreductase YuxK